MCYVNCLKLPIMKIHVKVGTFRSGKSIFLRLLLFKFHFKYAIKLFFIPYQNILLYDPFYDYFNITYWCNKCFLNEHCNENYFEGFVEFTFYEGKVDAEIHSRCWLCSFPDLDVASFQNRNMLSMFRRMLCLVRIYCANIIWQDPAKSVWKRAQSQFSAWLRWRNWISRSKFIR